MDHADARLSMPIETEKTIDQLARILNVPVTTVVNEALAHRLRSSTVPHLTAYERVLLGDTNYLVNYTNLFSATSQDKDVDAMRVMARVLNKEFNGRAFCLNPYQIWLAEVGLNLAPDQNRIMQVLTEFDSVIKSFAIPDFL